MALTVQICGKIMEDMCHQVNTNTDIRALEVAQQNGGHIEHIIHKG
jgi:hypothetical protein